MIRHTSRRTLTVFLYSSSTVSVEKIFLSVVIFLCSVASFRNLAFTNFLYFDFFLHFL